MDNKISTPVDEVVIKCQLAIKKITECAEQARKSGSTPEKSYVENFFKKIKEHIG